MKVAAFDVSKTATGWAATDGKVWEHGVLRCKLKPPFEKKNGALHAAYAGDVADWLRREVYTLLAAIRPDVAFIEQPLPGTSMRMRSVNKPDGFGGFIQENEKLGSASFEATFFLSGLALVVCSVCAKLHIEPRFIASQSWRSRLKIGVPPKSVPSKERRKWYKDKAREFCARIGQPVRNDDEAEGICMAYLLALETNLITNRPGDLFSSVAA